MIYLVVWDPDFAEYLTVEDLIIQAFASQSDADDFVRYDTSNRSLRVLPLRVA